jgi:hypothetical protein
MRQLQCWHSSASRCPLRAQNAAAYDAVCTAPQSGFSSTQLKPSPQTLTSRPCRQARAPVAALTPRRRGALRRSATCCPATVTASWQPPCRYELSARAVYHGAVQLKLISRLSNRHATGMQQAVRQVCRSKTAAWQAAASTCIGLRVCHAQSFVPACPAALWRPPGPGGRHAAGGVAAAGARQPGRPRGRNAAAAAASAGSRQRRCAAHSRCCSCARLQQGSSGGFATETTEQTCRHQLRCHVA